MLALKAIVVSLQNRTLLYFPATYRAHFYQRVIRLGARVLSSDHFAPEKSSASEGRAPPYLSETKQLYIVINLAQIYRPVHRSTATFYIISYTETEGFFVSEASKEVTERKLPRVSCHDIEGNAERPRAGRICSVGITERRSHKMMQVKRLCFMVPVEQFDF